MTVTVIRYFIALVSRLSVRAARRLGRWLGYGAWGLNTRGTRTARINLALCFPEMADAEREALVGRSMQHWGMTIFEVPGVWRRGVSGLSLIREVRGLEVFNAAREEKRGVIVVAPHHGNWEMVGLWLSTKGPLTCLYQPSRLGELDDILHAGRSSGGASLVPTNVRGVAALIKALKRGEMTGILPDMEPELNSGEFAPFFGVPALTMTLVHSLVERTGARVVMCFCRRLEEDFALYFQEPPAAIYGQDSVAAAVALNQGIENLVRIAPEQYQWEYKRFKRRPPGQVRVYPKD